MDPLPQRCDGPDLDPIPYVRGLYRLIPEARLIDILTLNQAWS